MPANTFAQMMVARIQAWRGYRQWLIDEGAHPSEIEKLGPVIAAMAKAKTHDDYLIELIDYHFNAGA